MSVGTNTTHEEIDATGRFNSLLIVLAFLGQIGGIAVKNMHILLLDVDMGEEVLPHKRVVALGMILGNLHILVHIERDDVLERQLSGLVLLDELLVEAQRRRSRGASQFERFALSRIGLNDALGNIIGCPLGHFLVVRFNNNSHTFNVIRNLNYLAPGTCYQKYETEGFPWSILFNS